MIKDKGGLTKRQMLLLETIAEKLEIDNKELCRIVGYSRRENMASKINILKKKGYLRGKIYDIDISMLAKNSIDILIFFFEFDLNYEFVLGILKSIFCWKWIYPLEESIHKQVAMMFYSTNETALLNILDYLCKIGILHDYIGFKIVGKPQRCSAKFLGKSETPDVGNLFGDYRQEKIEEKRRVTLNRVDLNLIMYLQDGYFNCNIRKIAEHYKNVIGFKADYKTQWLKSFMKMKENGIIKTRWIVFPQPIWNCRSFLLLLRGNDGENTKRLFYNFAKNQRLYVWKVLMVGLKAGIMRQESLEKLYSFFIINSDSTFYQQVVGYLDEYQELLPTIKRFSIRQFNPSEKELKRIFPDMPLKPLNWWTEKDFGNADYSEIPNYSFTMAINLEPDVYSVENQTLFYPYDQYLKRIKEIVEGIEIPFNEKTSIK